jgi:hypothetical protein
MYCVNLLDRLRGKFSDFTEGNEANEGFRSGGEQSLCFLWQNTAFALLVTFCSNGILTFERAFASAANA